MELKFIETRKRFERTDYYKSSWNRLFEYTTDYYETTYYGKKVEVSVQGEVKQGRKRVEYKTTVRYKRYYTDVYTYNEYDISEYTIKEKVKELSARAKKFEDYQKEVRAKRRKANKFIEENLLHKKVAKENLELIEDNEELFLKMNEVPVIKGYVWSKSPYSKSFYYHDKKDKIDWGTKPENSYRVADHWNWTGRHDGLKVHCAVEEDRYISHLEVRIQKDGKYRKVA